MHLCKKIENFEKGSSKTAFLHLRNVRAFGALRQALNPVQHLVALPTQLQSAMLAKSWNYFSMPLNSGSVMGLKYSSFCLRNEIIQSPLNY